MLEFVLSKHLNRRPALFLTPHGTVVFPKLVSKYYTVTSAQARPATTKIWLKLCPRYYLVADPDRYHFWRYVPVTLWQGLSQIGFSSAFPLSIMLVNRSPAT